MRLGTVRGEEILSTSPVGTAIAIVAAGGPAVCCSGAPER